MQATTATQYVDSVILAYARARLAGYVSADRIVHWILAHAARMGVPGDVRPLILPAVYAITDTRTYRSVVAQLDSVYAPD